MDKPNQYVNVVTNQPDEDEAILYEDHYLFTVRNAHKMSTFNLSLNNVGYVLNFSLILVLLVILLLQWIMKRPNILLF